jgi:hypothetical protein
MSPASFSAPAAESVSSALNRVWAELGAKARSGRLARRWTTIELAHWAGVSRTIVYTLERGEATSLEAAARVGSALGLRLELDLVDPRSRQRPVSSAADPVHSAMAEFEARWMRPYGFGLGIDEPYQHYQFAGRADLVAWHVGDRALLHIENRTRFPNLQETAGSFNAKRAYLGSALAERLGIGRWESETHVIVALWSAEVRHVLRLRTESFRSLCPDPPDVFDDWWRGRPLVHGRQSTFVVLDPRPPARARAFVGIDGALVARPRYRGYAEAAAALPVL